MSLERHASQIARIPGIGWRQAISQLSRETGLPANEAAKALSPYYLSKKETGDILTANYLGRLDPASTAFLQQTAAADVPWDAKVTHVSLGLMISENIANELLAKYRSN